MWHVDSGHHDQFSAARDAPAITRVGRDLLERSPRRPYADVAYLEAEQESSYSFDDTADFLARLREQAARMGCDGVVIGGVTHAADPVASVTANVNTSRKGLTATCIVYLPQAAATPSNPGASPPASTTATPPRSPSQPQAAGPSPEVTPSP